MRSFRTVYDTACEEIPYPDCRTEYDRKCTTIYEDVVSYKTENKCYWPKSKLKSEPCG